MEPLEHTTHNAIQKMTQVVLTKEILEMADMDGFVQKVTSTFAQLEQVGARMDKISKASLFMKLIYNVTGQTGQAQQDAMKLYGEVLQWVLQLSAVNTVLAKRISDQQIEVGRLTERILDQAQRQEQQDQKHFKELADLKKRHEELHHLIESQNGLLEILPTLRGEMDDLKAKFQGYDELREAHGREIDSIKNSVAEGEKATGVERDRITNLEKNLGKAVIALVVLSIVAVTGIVVLAFRLH